MKKIIGYSIFFLFMFSLLLSGNELTFANTYEDCILKNIGNAKTSESVDVVKQSCKEKFPKSFDFAKIAKKNAAKSWQEVIENPKFNSFTKEKKLKVRNQYFQVVIKPNVHPDFIQEAEEQFEIYARSIKRSSIKPVPPGSDAPYSILKPLLDLSANTRDKIDEQKVIFMKQSEGILNNFDAEPAAAWRILFISRTTENALEIIDKTYHLSNNLLDLFILHYEMEDDIKGRERWVNTKINYIFYIIDLNLNKLLELSLWYKEVDLVNFSNEIENYSNEANILLKELKTNLQNINIYSHTPYPKTN